MSRSSPHFIDWRLIFGEQTGGEEYNRVVNNDSVLAEVKVMGACSGAETMHVWRKLEKRSHKLVRKPTDRPKSRDSKICVALLESTIS